MLAIRCVGRIEHHHCVSTTTSIHPASRRRIQDLIDFDTEHGRMPASNSHATPAEKQLAHWRHKMLSKNGIPAVVQYLDHVLPHWRERQQSPATRRSKDTAHQVVDFYRKHGRIPLGGHGDEDERRLGRWLNRARVNNPESAACPILDAAQRGLWAWSSTYAKVSSRTEVLQMLDEGAPGWSVRRPKIIPRQSQLRVEQLIGFVDENGRLPRASDPSERQLYDWLYRYRSKQVNEITQKLDECVPGWASGVTGSVRTGRSVEHSARFHQRVDELVAFFAQHHSMPSAGSGDPHEQSLARWRSGSLLGIRLHTDVRDRLDALAPGWADQGLHSDTPHFQRAHDLIDFHHRTGRLPSVDSADPDQRVLGLWRRRYRDSDANWAVLRILDQRLPCWREDLVRQPVTRAGELIEFHRRHGRMPSTKGPSSTERGLAYWRIRAIRTEATADTELLDRELVGWRERQPGG